MSQFGAEYDALMDSIMSPPLNPPSVVEQKKSILSEKRKDKLLTIAPDVLAQEEEQEAEQLAANQASLTYKDLMGEDFNGGGSNLIDAVQASIYKTGQSFGELGVDAVGGLASMLGDTETEKYMDSIEFTPEEEVNQMVGYDPTQMQNKMDAVSKSYDEGDVLGTIGNAIKAVPDVLADSAGDLLALGLGGAGLFAKGANVANKSAKALKAEQALLKTTMRKEVGAVAEGAKAGTKFNKMKTFAKESKDLGTQIAKKQNTAQNLTKLDNIIRLNKGAIGLGAAYTNEQLNERKENNGGKSADVITGMSSFVANTVLFGAQFNIIKKFGKSAATDFAKDLTINTVKAATTGKTKDLAKAIMVNTAKVAEAAGAEAAQEYAQTWTQILTEKGGTEKYGSVMSVIGDKENQKEANMGAILGAAAGGSLRAAPIAVTAPIKATASISSKVIKGTANYAAEKATEASYGLLSADERAELKEQFDAEDADIAKSNESRQSQIDKIGEAKTIEELRALGDSKINEAIDSTIKSSKTLSKIIETVDNVTGADTLEKIAETSAYGRVLIDKMNTADKANPETVEVVKQKVLAHMKARINKNESAVLEPKLETIKNAAIAQYNKDIDVTKIASKFTQGKDIAKKVATNAYEKTKAKGQAVVDAIPQEAVDKVVELINEGKELTAETVDLVVENVKDTDKSIARALLDDLVSEKPRKATLTGLTKLNTETLAVLEKAVKSNPKARRIVKAAMERKKQIRSQFFGDEAKKTNTKNRETLKDDVKKSVSKTAQKIKDKLANLIGKDGTNKIKGLKSIFTDAIDNSESIKELNEFVEDMKGKIEEEFGEDAQSDAAEFLESFQAQLKAKGEELTKKGKEADAKEKAEEKAVEKEAVANRDFATMSSDEFSKASIDSVEFMYSLTMDDIKALSKNPNISDAVKQAVTVEYINLKQQEAKDIQETEDTVSKNVDTLLEDEFIKQAQDEEGCK